MKTALVVGVVASLLAGGAYALGANSDKNLKAQVAQQVMQGTRKLTQPEEVTLVKVKRGGMVRVTWEADTPNRHYACTSDGMLRNPSCVRVWRPSFRRRRLPGEELARPSVQGGGEDVHGG